MPDRQRVIKALEESYTYSNVDEGCTLVSQQTVLNAIALLKGQETVKPFHRCIRKSYSLIEDNYYVFCPYCGKRIEWQ